MDEQHGPNSPVATLCPDCERRRGAPRVVCTHPGGPQLSEKYRPGLRYGVGREASARLLRSGSAGRRPCSLFGQGRRQRTGSFRTALGHGALDAGDAVQCGQLVRHIGVKTAHAAALHHDEGWVQLSAGAGAVGIHDAAVSQGRPPGTTELGFTTDEPLETVADRPNDAGYAYDLVDENFGRSIRVTDPDGVIARIQEIDQDTVRRSAEGRAEPRPDASGPVHPHV